MKVIPVDQLQTAHLHVDACYQGGRFGNAADDPLPKLMRVDSQGGFRYRGKVKGTLEMLVLTTSMNGPDWPAHWILRPVFSRTMVITRSPCVTSTVRAAMAT